MDLPGPECEPIAAELAMGNGSTGTDRAPGHITVARPSADAEPRQGTNDKRFNASFQGRMQNRCELRTVIDRQRIQLAS